MPVSILMIWWDYTPGAEPEWRALGLSPSAATYAFQEHSVNDLTPLVSSGFSAPRGKN